MKKWQREGGSVGSCHQSAPSGFEKRKHYRACDDFVLGDEAQLDSANDAEQQNRLMRSWAEFCRSLPQMPEALYIVFQIFFGSYAAIHI